MTARAPDRCNPDHPRSRGEYAPSRQRNTGEQWIIPALAGNTFGCATVTPLTGDHPRSRGEYCDFSLLCIDGLGSSPLSRGIRDTYDYHAVRLGIIPALAGNTYMAGFLSVWFGDHPRSRGEYRAVTIRVRRGSGSSPLSRGIPRLEVRKGANQRTIPALAGNTSPP